MIRRLIILLLIVGCDDTCDICGEYASINKKWITVSYFYTTDDGSINSESDDGLYFKREWTFYTEGSAYPDIETEFDTISFPIPNGTECPFYADEEWNGFNENSSTGWNFIEINYNYSEPIMVDEIRYTPKSNIIEYDKQFYQTSIQDLEINKNGSSILYYDDCSPSYLCHCKLRINFEEL